MDDIDALAREQDCELRAHGGVHARAQRRVDLAGDGGNGAQLAADRRPFGRDHDRAMARGDERAIEPGEHLLGAADRIGAHRRERIGDADNGQRASPAATRRLHVARP
jgi:hypothetical protein